jgi:hypothetical protein
MNPSLTLCDASLGWGVTQPIVRWLIGSNQPRFIFDSSLLAPVRLCFARDRGFFCRGR